jgi:hypothetical protein
MLYRPLDSEQKGIVRMLMWKSYLGLTLQLETVRVGSSVDLLSLHEELS